jgi:glycine betaine catabolism A
MPDHPLPPSAALAGAMERSLPGSAYLSPAAFRVDCDSIFVREWFCAGREEDLAGPGDHMLVKVAGESIIVLRGRGGELRAFYNVCRHRGARLCDAGNDARWGIQLNGGVIGGVIRCPYHGWSYGLDGALLAAPNLAGTLDFAKADFGLHPVEAHCWGGFVWLNLTPDAAPDFAAAMGEAPRRLGNYPLADLRTTRTLTYAVQANWKLILENYNECYHCAGVHPELCDLVPEFRRAGGMHLDWEAGIPHRAGATTYTLTGTTSRAFFPGLSEEEQIRHKGELIYPNLMLSVSSDHAAAFILWPEAADLTRIECRFLFHKDEIARADFDPADAVDFWDLVNRQDWAVCERVQRGMDTRAQDHFHYSPMEDYSLDIRRYIAARQAATGGA